MKYSPEHIYDRIRELSEFISQTQRAMHDDDGTTIRISSQHGQTRYYLRPFGTKGDGIYLDKDNFYRVQPIVQRSYDMEAYKLAQQELLYLEQFLGLYPSKVVEDIYPSLHPARKELITPVELPTDEFIQQWLSVEWEHMGLWDDMTYRKNAIRRLAAYQRSGIFPGDQLILTFETSSYHPGFYDINAIIDHYLD